MTNEELAIKIKGSDMSLMPVLWVQIERYTAQQAAIFFRKHSKQCASMGIDLDDLKQESFFAVQKAVEGFNADKGAKFLTYATLHLTAHFYKVTKCDKTKEKQPVIVSLDAAAYNNDNDNNTNLGDLIPSDERLEEDTIERLAKEQASQVLWGEVERLGGKQAEIIKARYASGLDCKQAANSLGIDLNAAKNLEKKALNSLRRRKHLLNLLEVYDAMNYRGTSLTTFRRRCMSNVEYVTFKRLELLNYLDDTKTR